MAAVAFMKSGIRPPVAMTAMLSTQLVPLLSTFSLLHTVRYTQQFRFLLACIRFDWVSSHRTFSYGLFSFHLKHLAGEISRAVDEDEANGVCCCCFSGAGVVSYLRIICDAK